MQLPWQKPEPVTAAQVVEEFIAVYREKLPDETLGELAPESLEWKKSDGSSHRIMLHKVFDSVARLPKNTLKTRREIYEHFIESAFSGEAMPEKFSDEYRARVLPAIRMRGYLEYVRKQIPGEVPHRALSKDLVATYVIDFPDRTAHILAPQAEDLGLDEAGLWELAMTNLRPKLSREKFREMFEERNQHIAAATCPDGHAAARLLLARDFLEEGEEIAAVVPDGGMLILPPVPPDNNWNPIRQMASEADRTGFSRPFWVRAGRLDLM